jgi:hypothetical protein
MRNAQELAGYIIQHRTSMGVNAAAVELGAQFGPNKAKVLTKQEAFSLALANDPLPKPSWTLRPVASGMELASRGVINQVSYSASIACDRTVPGRLAVRFSLQPDMSFVDGRSPREVTAVLRENFSGIGWTDLSTPASGLLGRYWPIPRTLELRWDGRNLLIAAPIPPEVLILLSSCGDAMLSLDFPGSIGRSLPALVIAAPELARARALLLRNCPT